MTTTPRCSASTPPPRWSPGKSRAARMLMPRSVDVVADFGVCARPVTLRRTNLDSGRTEVIDMPCGAT
ncbi:hypothetical protein [Micromonospora sp. NPDC005806]|uniref:hypothetical protein n=1 Tax=Micromonospora sp. NPDC005806 TaxID=3364234 RepID=UPI0036B2F7A5